MDLSVTTASSINVLLYDPACGATTPLRSEPAQRIIAQPAAPDRVDLSAEGREKSRQQVNRAEVPAKTGEDNGKKTVSAPAADLDMEELKMVEQLKQRDREVKAHEQAHLANAGQYAAGGPSYTYQQGPDGRRYAVGGEVPIDVSRERSPETTIQKMRTVRRAALAPARPSSADRSIAAAASEKEAEARKELQDRQVKERKTSGPEGADTTDDTETVAGQPAERMEASQPFGGITA